MRYPEALQKLIEMLAKLPGVGPKTAERYAFFLLDQPESMTKEFSVRLGELKEKTIICQLCGNISEKSPCPTCLDANRDQKTLCLIADSRELAAIEATRQYNGRYFVLGGLIDTVEGVGPEKLRIRELLKKLDQEPIEEVILAFDPTIEGEATSMYLSKILREKGVRLTRLARGLPAGANLEYADEMTITNALKYRNEC
ncbi:MAG: recombination mediator RecR [Candidatus Falkowbacteria bacterium]|nr:recombination mediator RecR [Candidatus Falkowbacteria bacterium]